MVVEISRILVQVLDGLLFGSVLALLAMGLSLIFGLMGIANFAHGSFYALGAYLAWTVITVIGTPNSFFIALLLVPILMAVIGIVTDITVIRPLYDHDNFTISSLLLTFGLLLAIEGLILLFWGGGGKGVGTPLILDGSISLGGITYPIYRLFIMVIMFLIAGTVWIFLQKTNIGITVRAATENRDMVKSLGINIKNINTMVFAIGIALAGLSGVLHAPLVNVFPEMGHTIIIQAFVVVVIGGLTSFRGSIVAGLLVGVVSQLSFLVWPAITQIIVFVFMAVILLLKPEGLLGSETGGIEH
jgi:branched-subunit amino acid ABC-type transport system permease component